MARTVSEITASLKDLSSASFNNEAERVQVEQALGAALRRVQRPFGTVLDHVWTEPITTAFIKHLTDTGFFEKWAKKYRSTSSPRFRVLSAHRSSEIILVNMRFTEREFRFLLAQELIHETNGKYELTDYSKALAGPEFSAIYTCLYEVQQPCFANWPKFAAKTRNKNPIDAVHNNFTDWHKGDFFSFLKASPAAAAAFNKTMTVVASSKVPWVDLYPTANLVADAKAHPNKTLLVDVAGVVGHDLEQLRAKHPEIAGQLVLQDLPKVVENAQVTAPVQKQAMNMLEGPNPVKGARVYCLKTVLHDWPDAKAVEILQNIAKSMDRDYSRVLLHETVISKNNANPRTVASDATMMLCFSAGEREEGTWRDIAGKAGLRVVKIWAPEALDSIIELALA